MNRLPATTPEDAVELCLELRGGNSLLGIFIPDDERPSVFVVARTTGDVNDGELYIRAPELTTAFRPRRILSFRYFDAVANWYVYRELG